jgi:MOSC domain-containing protein YiiM
MTHDNGGHGRIHQISTSPGGVPKLAIREARVTQRGIEGDGHRSPSHGGPEAALCLFSLEVIRALQADGHPIAPGTIGENLTLEGVDLGSLTPGDRLALGSEVEVQLTRYTTPCTNIAGSFVGGDFSQVLQAQHPGRSRIYARVIREGTLRPGDPVRVLPPQAE